MSTSDPSSDLTDGYICKICGLSFLSLQSLAAHIDSEHPEAEQPEVL
jgi:C2H2-type zinc finger